MKKQIDYSNEQAAKNRNLYPIQEQATQEEIWEYSRCTCDENCSCKQLGCTHHWKLKTDVQFEEYMMGFLRMFVDRCEHLNLITAIDKGDPSNLKPRVKGAYAVLHALKGENWVHLSTKAANHNKTLFCDGWADDFFKEQFESFRIKDSVYYAKKFCVLLPDIGVPYDTKSRDKMIKQLDIKSDVDYYQFLSQVRSKFLNAFKEQKVRLPIIRTLDSPFDSSQEHLCFDPRLISLRKPDVNYGTKYLPTDKQIREKQISLVLDKCYYSPTDVGTPNIITSSNNCFKSKSF